METVEHVAIDLGRAVVMRDHFASRAFSNVIYDLNGSLTDYDPVLMVLHKLKRQSSVVQTSVSIVQSIVARYMPVYVQHGHAIQFMIRLVRVMLASSTLHTLVVRLTRIDRLFDTTHVMSQMSLALHISY